MPKSLYQQSFKNKRRRKNFSENFLPFLNLQLKNSLVLGFIGLKNMKSGLERNKNLLPTEIFAGFTAFYRQISNALDRMNEITTLMTLLKDLVKNYPAQPQKMNAVIHLIPIIEKYRRKAQVQGIGFIFHADLPQDDVYGGKVEFEHILELLLTNALEQSEKGAIELSLQMINAKLCFRIKGGIQTFDQKENIGSFKISPKNASLHAKEVLSRIRFRIAQKLVEKIKGEITQHGQRSDNEIQVKMPVKILS